MDNQLYSQVKKLHSEGLSNDKISEKLGLSDESRVTQIMNDMNNEEVRQTSMIDDLRMASEMLQEIRKRLCDIGESTGCVGCITNNIEDNATSARTELFRIVEYTTLVLNAVKDLQRFIG